MPQPRSCLGCCSRLCATKRSAPWPGAGKVSSPSQLQVVSTVYSGLLYPLSHPARHVAGDQGESFQRAGLSATSPSAGDLARVMLPCQAAATSCPGGRGLRLPQTPTWDTRAGPHASPGRPATSRQQTLALISLLWFLCCLKRQKRGRRRDLTASPQSRGVCHAGHRAGTAGARGAARGAQRLGALLRVSFL